MRIFANPRMLKWTAGAVLMLAVLLAAGVLIAAKRRRGSETETSRASLMNHPLPTANLLDAGGQKLDDSALRKGKVVLVFVAPDCPPCAAESQFLKPLIDKRSDVKFYGVVSFGATQASVKKVDKEFPFKIYFDTEPRLAGELGLYRVPIKLFLDDGIIRKSWKGASTDESMKIEFTRWLEEVK